MFSASYTYVVRSRPPRGSTKKKAIANGEESSSPPVPVSPSWPPWVFSLSPGPISQTLAEQLSYLNYARPFKNPNYTKNASRRTKNLKNVLTQERERERAERERRRQEREENMDLDSESAPVSKEEEIPTCTS